MKDKDEIILHKVMRYIQSAMSYVQDMEYPEFLKDEKTVSATAFMLGQIGEITNAISLETQEENPCVPWKIMRGMRNRIIHDYENLYTRSYDYSVRNATTGSFFAAILDGMNPAIHVSPMLPSTSIMAYRNGRSAIPVTPTSPETMLFTGI